MSKLDEFNENIKNKKIAIIGLGVSNIPLIDYFYEHKAKVVVFNDKEIAEEILEKLKKYGIDYIIAKEYNTMLADFDYIFRSPSCLPTRGDLMYAKEHGAIVTTEIEMTIMLTDAKVIGVTGSDGKTTTSTLISLILKASNHNVFLGGNIGVPLFTKLKDIKKDDIIVLELSSFQLMNMNVSPLISIITNISPNHLDIHSSYQEYIDAKTNIFKHPNNKKLILNYDNEVTNSFKDANREVILFSSKKLLNHGYSYYDNIIYKDKEELMRTDNIKIKGVHNYENIMAALASCYELIDINKAIEAITSFNGVEHRLEFVREINKVKWYNDSVSSSPSRTIAGLKTFKENIVLIAGGYDKNLDYDNLAKEMISRVNKLILFGATKDKILASLNKYDNNIEIYVLNTLEEVVKKAYEVSKENEIVLFSPASASFDMFKNFADRGIKFKNLVLSLNDDKEK